MFEKFTERARRVVVLAQEEARDLAHNYIGTEHILLGLLREQEGLAAWVLAELDITVERVREQIVRIVGSGEEVTSDQIPFTPRAKKVLELALREALSLGHNYIATEHILLGLARENEGVAARILLDFGADAEKIRDKVIGLLQDPAARLSAEARASGLGGRGKAIDQGWLGGLGAILNRLAGEIRQELRRDPDVGDLLLALACTPHTVSGQALSELGVDIDALWGTIERVRLQSAKAHDVLMERIREARSAKEQALEAHEFEPAARLRDQERELIEQTRAPLVMPPEVLQDIRRHLGLPRAGDAL